MSARAHHTTTPLLLTIVAVALGGCSTRPSVAEQREKVLGDMYAAYDQQLQQLAPDYVVVTYPTDLHAMPEVKHAEMRVVRSVLNDRHIPYQLTRHADSIVSLVNEKDWQHLEYQAYAVPAAAVDACRAGRLLYLNLDLHDPVLTKRHPIASENEIDVQVWDDPLTMPEQWLRLWSPAAGKTAT